jgi:hypothetical protein
MDVHNSKCSPANANRMNNLNFEETKRPSKQASSGPDQNHFNINYYSNDTNTNHSRKMRVNGIVGTGGGVSDDCSSSLMYMNSAFFGEGVPARMQSRHMRNLMFDTDSRNPLSTMNGSRDEIV